MNRLDDLVVNPVRRGSQETMPDYSVTSLGSPVTTPGHTHRGRSPYLPPPPEVPPPPGNRLFMEGKMSAINPREKLEPINKGTGRRSSEGLGLGGPQGEVSEHSEGLVGDPQEGEDREYNGEPGFRVSLTPPHNFTQAQAKYAELIGDDIFSSAADDPALIAGSGGFHPTEEGSSPSRQPVGGLRGPEPLIVPDGFRGLSDVNPLNWGGAVTATGHMLRDVERLKMPPPPLDKKVKLQMQNQFGPFDPVPMHPPDPSTLPILPNVSGVKPIIGYERGTSDGRVRVKDSRWTEGVFKRGEEMKAMQELMHCLWSDKPVNQLVKNLDNLSSLQRHSAMEVIIGLMRNTGIVTQVMCNMTSSLDVYYTGQSVLEGSMVLAGASFCVFHVVSDSLRGKDLLWRLQHKGPSKTEGTNKMETYITSAPEVGKGLVGACLEMQEPLVSWDAQADARYCKEVDSAILGFQVPGGASMACVPVVDDRWVTGGPPGDASGHVLGVLQLIVPHGPDQGRRKRLGLEMRQLLAMVGYHAGQCLTNATLYTEQCERTSRVNANQKIMTTLNAGMTEEQMAANISIAISEMTHAARAAVFLVQPSSDGEKPRMSRVEVEPRPDGGDSQVHVMDGVPVAAGIAGMVVRSGEHHNTSQPLSDPSSSAFSSHIDIIPPTTVQPEQEEGKAPPDPVQHHLLSIPVLSNMTDNPKENANWAIAVLQVAKPIEQQPFSAMDIEALLELGRLWAPLLDVMSVDRISRAVAEATVHQHSLSNQLMQEVADSNEATDLEKALVEHMVLATELLKADRSTVWVVDHQNDQLVSCYRRELDVASARENEIRVPLTSSIASEAARSGGAVRVVDAYSHPSFNKENDIKTGYVTTSILAVPIFQRDGMAARTATDTLESDAPPGKKIMSAANVKAAETSLAHNGVIGVVQMINKVDGSSFSDRDSQLLSIVVQSMSAMLEAQVIFENIRQSALLRTTKNKQLLKALSDMATTSDVEEIVRIGEMVAVTLMRCQGAQIYLVDKDKDWDKYRVWKHNSEVTQERQETVMLEVGHIGQSLKHQEIIRRHLRGESYLAAPVLSESGDVVAVLQLHNKRSSDPHHPDDIIAFDEDEDHRCCLPYLLQNLGTVLAQAIQKDTEVVEAKLFAELHQVVVHVDQQADAKGIFAAINSKGRAMLKCQKCLLYVMDQQAGSMMTLMGSQRVEVPLGSIVGQVALSGKPFTATDVTKDARYDPPKNELLGQIKSAVCVPVCAPNSGKVLGALLAVNKMPTKSAHVLCPAEALQFSNTQEKVLTAMASSLGALLPQAMSLQAERAAVAHLQAVVHSLKGTLVVLDKHGMLKSSNKPLDLVTRATKDKTISQTYENWMEYDMKLDVQLAYNKKMQLVAGDYSMPLDQRGSVRHITYRIVPFLEPSSGGTSGLSGAFQPRGLLSTFKSLGFPSEDLGCEGGAVILAHQLTSDDRTKAALERTFSPLNARLAMEKQLHIMPQKLRVTTLFCGLRSSSSYFSTPGATRMFGRVNEVFSRLAPLVTRVGGRLHSYHGDAFLAVFGMPSPADRSKGEMIEEEAAVQASIDILQEVEKMNRDFAEIDGQEYKGDLVVSMCVSTAMQVVGCIGTDQLLEVGLTGDGVKQAMVFAKFAKRYFLDVSSLIITDMTYKVVQLSHWFRELDVLTVAGQSARVSIFQYLGRKPQDFPPAFQKAMQFYAEALTLYKEGRWGPAMPYFRKVSALCKKEDTPQGDTPSDEMVHRCVFLLENPPAAWRGAYTVEWR